MLSHAYCHDVTKVGPFLTGVDGSSGVVYSDHSFLGAQLELRHLDSSPASTTCCENGYPLGRKKKTQDERHSNVVLATRRDGTALLSSHPPSRTLTGRRIAQLAPHSVHLLAVSRRPTSPPIKPDCVFPFNCLVSTARTVRSYRRGYTAQKAVITPSSADGIQNMGMAWRGRAGHPLPGSSQVTRVPISPLSSPSAALRHSPVPTCRWTAQPSGPGLAKRDLPIPVADVAMHHRLFRFLSLEDGEMPSNSLQVGS